MATILIPARWASTRFPGKPLALLAGKPLIQHVWEQCARSKTAARIIIATDDMRIAEAAFDFGAEVALTRSDHPSGTDRAAEVAALLKRERVLVNVQGDEPFVEPKLIDRLIREFKNDRSLEMATAASPIHDIAEFHDPNIVKVVLNLDGNALYFSRAPIPVNRDNEAHSLSFRHHGIYAYTKEFLLRFVTWKPTALEKSEKLEQLRALEHGITIRVLKTKGTSPGIDTPEQAVAAERQILRAGES
ncbi:MAG: 3-deoxy-manno-octulosonate cytidylyltransferase [Terrimicrobiaceae bacterium]